MFYFLLRLIDDIGNIVYCIEEFDVKRKRRIYISFFSKRKNDAIYKYYFLNGTSEFKPIMRPHKKILFASVYGIDVTKYVLHFEEIKDILMLAILDDALNALKLIDQLGDLKCHCILNDVYLTEIEYQDIIKIDI